MLRSSRVLSGLFTALTCLGACQSNRAPEPSASTSTSGSSPALADAASLAPAALAPSSLAPAALAPSSLAPAAFASSSLAAAALVPAPTGATRPADAGAKGPSQMMSHLSCRIIEGVGEARRETTPDASVPMMVNEPVPSTWVDMAAGSHFLVKDARTNRDTRFIGPGRIKGCVRLDEESWIAMGGFDGTSDPVADGSQEWVVTPFGVVRYATAKLSVGVLPDGVRITISSGDADLWVPSDATVRQGAAGAATNGHDDWIHAGVDNFTLTSATHRTLLTLDGARAALATCTTLSGSSRSRGRAACAVAWLRLDYLPPSSETASLNAPLAQAMARWNALPDPSASASTHSP